MKYKLSAKDVNVFYGDLKALNNINIKSVKIYYTDDFVYLKAYRI